jgi:hypothetical protein
VSDTFSPRLVPEQPRIGLPGDIYEALDRALVLHDYFGRLRGFGDTFAVPATMQLRWPLDVDGLSGLLTAAKSAVEHLLPELPHRGAVSCGEHHGQTAFEVVVKVADSTLWVLRDVMASTPDNPKAVSEAMSRWGKSDSFSRKEWGRLREDLIFEAEELAKRRQEIEEQPLDEAVGLVEGRAKVLADGPRPPNLVVRRGQRAEIGMCHDVELAQGPAAAAASQAQSEEPKSTDRPEAANARSAPAVGPSATPAEGSGKSEGFGDQGFVFRLDGALYFIAGFGERGHLPKLKGFDQLAKLVASPGAPVLMYELLGTVGDQRFLQDRHSRQEAFGPEGKRELHDKIREVKADLEQAKKENNFRLQESLQTEYERLIGFVNAGTGRRRKGRAGKDRDLNNVYDKLRSRIRGTLNTAFEKLRSMDRPMKKLADHLDLCISSEGSTFIYRPVPSISWQTEKLDQI